jgi:hypothetical protein
MPRVVGLVVTDLRATPTAANPYAKIVTRGPAGHHQRGRRNDAARVRLPAIGLRQLAVSYRQLRRVVASDREHKSIGHDRPGDGMG